MPSRRRSPACDTWLHEGSHALWSYNALSSGKLSAPPFNTDDGAAGQLAAKTVKVLASLPSVTRLKDVYKDEWRSEGSDRLVAHRLIVCCSACGSLNTWWVRYHCFSEHHRSTLRHARIAILYLAQPPLSSAGRAVDIPCCPQHCLILRSSADFRWRCECTKICMWYATAIHESDHGTSKHWRLPVKVSWSNGVSESLSQKESPLIEDSHPRKATPKAEIQEHDASPSTFRAIFQDFRSIVLPFSQSEQTAASGVSPNVEESLPRRAWSDRARREPAWRGVYSAYMRDQKGGKAIFLESLGHSLVRCIDGSFEDHG